MIALYVLNAGLPSCLDHRYPKTYRKMIELEEGCSAERVTQLDRATTGGAWQAEFLRHLIYRGLDPLARNRPSSLECAKLLQKILLLDAAPGSGCGDDLWTLHKLIFVNPKVDAAVGMETAAETEAQETAVGMETVAPETQAAAETEAAAETQAAATEAAAAETEAAVAAVVAAAESEAAAAERAHHHHLHTTFSLKPPTERYLKDGVLCKLFPGLPEMQPKPPEWWVLDRNKAIYETVNLDADKAAEAAKKLAELDAASGGQVMRCLHARQPSMPARVGHSMPPPPPPAARRLPLVTPTAAGEVGPEVSSGEANRAKRQKIEQKAISPDPPPPPYIGRRSTATPPPKQPGKRSALSVMSGSGPAW